jgi:hypothetical protein
MKVLEDDAPIKVHKFLKDCDALLGSVDSLLDRKVSTEMESHAIPKLGSVREMALRLRERLALLTR